MGFPKKASMISLIKASASVPTFGSRINRVEVSHGNLIALRSTGAGSLASSAGSATFTSNRIPGKPHGEVLRWEKWTSSFSIRFSKEGEKEWKNNEWPKRGPPISFIFEGKHRKVVFGQYRIGQKGENRGGKKRKEKKRASSPVGLLG